MERLQKKLERFCMLTPIVVSVILVASAFAHAELTKIADNVYSYVDVKNSSPTNSFAANAGIVIGRDAILVVDTLISAKEAQRFIKDIRKISDKPIRYVVNTHYHLDHSLGNCEFARQGAIIISQTNDRKNLEKKGAEELKSARSYGLSEEEMAGTVVTLPSVTFSDRMTIDLGSETVELIFIASSHTDGSALVYLPLRKVLFAGDILFTDFHPFMGDGDIAGWVETLDYMLFSSMPTRLFPDTVRSPARGMLRI